MKTKSITTRRGLGFTSDDMRRVKRLQNRLRLTHGDLTLTGLVKLALLRLESNMDAEKPSV